MSISNYTEKIKQLATSEQGKDIMIVVIVILVGLGCFALGRMSKESVSEGQNNLKSASPIKQPETSGRNFFASSKGSKYYSEGCSGGKTIKKENKVYFDTKEEAEKAGYTLSSSCN